MFSLKALISYTKCCVLILKSWSATAHYQLQAKQNAKEQT